MTDEEIAYEYAKYDDNGRVSVNDDKFKAFLAGLKAGRPKWHDLRKDPNDLPERISFLSKTVINQIGTPCHYNYALECWQNCSNTEIDPPIAWCEIPKYTEE